jgi:nucleoside-diphosphate kinase
LSESTLVIIKPDAYDRGLTGAILERFERLGLVLEAIRVSRDERHLVQEHYPLTDDWLTAVGNKSLDEYSRLGLNPSHYLGTSDPIEVGRQVHRWLQDYLTGGPMVAMVLSGNRAIDVVRKLIGGTIPADAAPGTIRGDFSSDSARLANVEKRAVRNLIHASGDADEAAREIKLWFSL